MTTTLPGAVGSTMGMIHRAELVAQELDRLGIKPCYIQIGRHYMYGQPGRPFADDAVSMQAINGRQFLLIESALGLTRADGAESNVYASGVWRNVAVVLFTGRDEVEAVEGS